MNVLAGHAPPTQKERIIIDHSSWLMYAEYDPTSLRLEIGLKNGAIKQHWPVYPQTFLDFKLAPSKGRYYNQAIMKVTPAIEIKR